VCSVIILDEKIIGFLALLQGWYPTTSWKTWDFACLSSGLIYSTFTK
jgi:hypothetical protein